MTNILEYDIECKKKFTTNLVKISKGYLKKGIKMEVIKLPKF